MNKNIYLEKSNNKTNDNCMYCLYPWEDTEKKDREGSLSFFNWLSEEEEATDLCNIFTINKKRFYGNSCMCKL